MFTSQFEIDEATGGDPTAAAERIKALNDLPLLSIEGEVVPLGERLLDEGALPAKAQLDSLHLVTAAVNGIQFLLTWNCKHLANAALWARIEATCRSAGFIPPTICTPLQLLGMDP